MQSKKSNPKGKTENVKSNYVVTQANGNQLYTFSDPNPLLDASIFDNMTQKERQQVKIRLSDEKLEQLQIRLNYAVIVNVVLVILVLTVLVFGN